MTLWLPTTSLRLRLFLALAAATLCGALATGLYAVAADAQALGFTARLAKVMPRALALAALLLPAAALGAAYVGRRLARPIEDLAAAATRIAEGNRATRLPRGEGSEMRRLSRALVSMRRELEGKPYAAAFLRDAWHDLKTPVAALHATLEVLEDDGWGDPATAQLFLANLRRSTDQLERTLADLVTLARFETGSLRPDEPTSIHELVSDALLRVDPLAEATQVTVAGGRQVDPRPATHAAWRPGLDRVRCDPSAIARALANLLQNAVGATPGGSVSVEVDVEALDRVTVDIVNEPALVPHETRAHLFERAPTSRTGSSGLGLAMVRAAVEAHGGSVAFLEMGPPRVRVRVELPR